MSFSLVTLIQHPLWSENKQIQSDEQITRRFCSIMRRKVLNRFQTYVAHETLSLFVPHLNVLCLDWTRAKAKYLGRLVNDFFYYKKKSERENDSNWHQIEIEIVNVSNVDMETANRFEKY